MHYYPRKVDTDQFTVVVVVVVVVFFVFVSLFVCFCVSLFKQLNQLPLA